MRRTWVGRIAWVAWIAMVSAACLDLRSLGNGQGDAGNGAANDGPSDGPNDRSAPDVSVDTSDSDAEGGSAYARMIVNDVPLAYWRMGTAVAGTIRDETGRGNDLFFEGAGSPRSALGAIANDPDTAIELDGAGARFVATNARALDLAGVPMTVEIWAKWNGGDAGAFQHLVGNSVGVGDARRGYLFYIMPLYSKAAFEWDSDQGRFTTMETPITFSANVFVHYVGVYEASTVRGYANGKLFNAKSTLGSLFTRTSRFVVGSDDPYSTAHFAGVVDEVAVYARALSAADVERHYLAGRGN